MAVRSSGAKSSAGNKRSVKKAVSLAENKAVTAAKVDAGADKNSLKLDVNVFKEKIVHHLRCTIGTSEKKASKLAWWQALVATANELIFDRLTQTQYTHATKDTRAVHYLSAEFLMGRLTVNNLVSLEVYNTAKSALQEFDAFINQLNRRKGVEQ